MLEVARGASTTVMLRGLAAGLTFGLYVLLGRLLGPEGAGTFFLAFTVSTIASVLGRVGLDTTLLRFTAGSSATGDWVAVKGVYQQALRRAAAGSTLAALVMVAGARWAASHLFGEEALGGPMTVMAISVVPLALLTLHAQALQGLRRMRDANLVGFVGVPLGALLGALVLVPKWQVLGAAWGYVFACVATLGLGWWLWNRATPHLSGLQGHIDTRTLLASSVPLFWVSGLQLIILWASTLALGVWASTADVGRFSVANRTATVASFALIAINSIAAPKFAALFKQGDMATLGKIARNTTTLTAAVAAPLMACFVLLPREVLGLFGSGFAESAPVLSILALGQFVNAITGAVGSLLTMCGYERLQRNNLAGCAILGVILNVGLVPRFGAIGAAIATATTLAVQMVVATAMVWRKLGVITVPLVARRSFPTGGRRV